MKHALLEHAEQMETDFAVLVNDLRIIVEGAGVASEPSTSRGSEGTGKNVPHEAIGDGDDCEQLWHLLGLGDPPCWGVNIPTIIAAVEKRSVPRVSDGAGEETLRAQFRVAHEVLVSRAQSRVTDAIGDATAQALGDANRELWRVFELALASRRSSGTPETPDARLANEGDVEWATEVAGKLLSRIWEFNPDWITELAMFGPFVVGETEEGQLGVWRGHPEDGQPALETFGSYEEGAGDLIAWLCAHRESVSEPAGLAPTDSEKASER